MIPAPAIQDLRAQLERIRQTPGEDARKAEAIRALTELIEKLGGTQHAARRTQAGSA